MPLQLDRCLLKKHAGRLENSLHLPKDIEEINLMLDKIEMILELHLWVEGDGDQ